MSDERPIDAELRPNIKVLKSFKARKERPVSFWQHLKMSQCIFKVIKGQIIGLCLKFIKGREGSAFSGRERS